MQMVMVEGLITLLVAILSRWRWQSHTTLTKPLRIKVLSDLPPSPFAYPPPYRIQQCFLLLQGDLVVTNFYFILSSANLLFTISSYGATFSNSPAFVITSCNRSKDSLVIIGVVFQASILL